jgi:hypothetical protein
MDLATVKVLSKNEALRGQYFDVYYHKENNDIELIAVETVTHIGNLMSTFSKQDLADIRVSLKDKLLIDSVLRINKGFTQTEINAGFVQAADENKVRGLSND